MTNIRPIIKGIHSPDALDLPNFIPDDPECFALLIQIFVGSENSKGKESFDLIVCSSGWLRKEAGKDGIVDCRHHLVMNNFNFPKLREFLDRYVRGCEGKDWDEVAAKLSRLGHWEFEDYRP